MQKKNVVACYIRQTAPIDSCLFLVAETDKIYGSLHINLVLCSNFSQSDVYVNLQNCKILFCVICKEMQLGV